MYVCMYVRKYVRMNVFRRHSLFCFEGLLLSIARFFARWNRLQWSGGEERTAPMRNVIATAGLFGSAAGQRGLFVPGAHVAPAPPTVYLPEAAAPAQAVAYPVYVQPVSQTSEGRSLRC